MQEMTNRTITKHHREKAFVSEIVFHFYRHLSRG
jgi:hypothetical protein